MWVANAAVTLKDMIHKNNQAFGENTASGLLARQMDQALRIESSPAGYQLPAAACNF